MNFKKMAEEVQNKYFERGGGEHYNHIAIEEIASALASAEKKGREEGRKEAQDFHFHGSCVSLDKYKALFHERDRAWNEAIEEARNVAEEHKSTDGECPESIANAEGYRTAVSQIAESIQRLKRG